MDSQSLNLDNFWYKIFWIYKKKHRCEEKKTETVIHLKLRQSGYLIFLKIL